MNNGVIVIRPTSTGDAKSWVQTPGEVVGECDSKGWIFTDYSVPGKVGTYDEGRKYEADLRTTGYVVDDVGMGLFVPCSNGPQGDEYAREVAAYVMQGPLPKVHEFL